MAEITQIDHAEYQKKVKRMTVEELKYTVRDCREAIDAHPEGHKAGYYQDEIHYCAGELRKRGTTASKNSNPL
jgi:hypothetical protein